MDYHAKDVELPVELSKTSVPMKWNQPPKKAVNPACASDMTFVKPSHGDVHEASKSTGRSAFDPRRSAFDPRRTEDCVLHKQRLQQLMVRLEKTVPNTGVIQFWQPGHSGSQVHVETLWQHVIFSHQHASTVVQESSRGCTVLRLPS